MAWKREEGDSFIWKDDELPIHSQPLMWGTMPQGERRASMSMTKRRTVNGVAADLAQEDADALKHELDETGSVGAFVEILMGSSVGGKLFTKVMASQHLNFDQKHYMSREMQLQIEMEIGIICFWISGKCGDHAKFWKRPMSHRCVCVSDVGKR